MGKEAPVRSRRRTANERYRQSFLAQAAAELHELAQLLVEEPDAQESVAFELRKLAATAETLELSSVSRAAGDAAEELAEPGVGVRALRRVANAIRHTAGRLRFGPIVVVGAPPEEARQLEEDARLCCEPLELYDDLAAFAVGLHTEQPSAVVLPVEAVDAVGQLVGRERFPVLVHGAPIAWEPRALALQGGAHGFLVQPFTLADVTRLARWRAATQEDAFEVLLLADPDPTREALAQAMEQLGIAVVSASDPAELAFALEAGTPRAVVLGARVGAHSALSLAQLVRAHPRCNHLPILVSGRPDDPAALRLCGVDDVMRTDAQPLQAAQRVRDRVVRMAGLPWERDPVTGLPNRLGVLDALDRELARASRSGEVLSVAVIDLEGLRPVVERFGATVLHRVRRLLVGLFDRHLRRTDLYGELGLGEVVVALPGCARDVALARIGAVVEPFCAECRRDPQLESIACALGVADTEEGLATVAIRAERDLRGATSSGSGAR